jgi:hypothetical protein
VPYNLFFFDDIVLILVRMGFLLTAFYAIVVLKRVSVRRLRKVNLSLFFFSKWLLSVFATNAKGVLN